MDLVTTRNQELYVLSPRDETLAEGTRDVMLAGSSPSYSLQVKSGVTHSLIENITGIRSLLGQSLGTTISSATFSGDNFNLQTNDFGGLGKQVLLLKVAVVILALELRHLDTSSGILDIAFAQINSQGRAEIPEAGFEQDPSILKRDSEF